MGERQVLTHNFCANSPLIGYERDLRTGGLCSRDEDDLPDEHCMFYVDQETAATASYMALPYLDTVQNFCDMTEDNLHDTELPTKQNLYCDQRSTWEVSLLMSTKTLKYLLIVISVISNIYYLYIYISNIYVSMCYVKYGIFVIA